MHAVTLFTERIGNKLTPKVMLPARIIARVQGRRPRIGPIRLVPLAWYKSKGSGRSGTIWRPGKSATGTPTRAVASGTTPLEGTLGSAGAVTGTRRDDTTRIAQQGYA